MEIWDSSMEQWMITEPSYPESSVNTQVDRL